jgi:hypothetical protein
MGRDAGEEFQAETEHREEAPKQRNFNRIGRLAVVDSLPAPDGHVAP